MSRPPAQGGARYVPDGQHEPRDAHPFPHRRSGLLPWRRVSDSGSERILAGSALRQAPRRAAGRSCRESQDLAEIPDGTINQKNISMFFWRPVRSRQTARRPRIGPGQALCSGSAEPVKILSEPESENPKRGFIPTKVPNVPQDFCCGWMATPEGRRPTGSMCGSVRRERGRGARCLARSCAIIVQAAPRLRRRTGGCAPRPRSPAPGA